MKNLNFFIAVLFVIVLVSLVMVVGQARAQLIPYPFINPFFMPPVPFGINPFFAPFIPPMPVYSPPVLNPLTASNPFISRSGAATIVLLPQVTNPVTAYAPLGTLNLTPSTLVFLILILSLEE